MSLSQTPSFNRRREEEAGAHIGETKSRHLVFIDHYATPPGIPGILRQHEFALELKTHAWETTIVHSGYGHANQEFIRPVGLMNLVREDELEGVHYRSVYTIPYTDNGLKRYLNNASYFFTSQLRGFRGKEPDLVIGVNPHLLGALSGWFLAKRYRVPFILEVHDLWPDSLIQLGLRNRLVVHALEMLERFLYRKADAIIAVADGIVDGIRKKIGHEKRILLLPSGADVEPPLDDVKRLRMRRGRGWDGRYVVIWTGAHGPANSLETIIDAARLISVSETDAEILFVLVGDGADKRRLMNMSQDLDNVQFIDPVPASEIPQLLRLADAGIIVHSDTRAVRGTRPTKLTEYMAAGLPIISNLQGETARLIEEAQCGTTVPTMRADLLAETVRNFASQGPKVRELGSNGIKFVKTLYDRGKLAIQLVNLLNEMADDEVKPSVRIKTD